MTITYLVGCRNCLNGDSVRHQYLITDENDDEFRKKTEFEAISLIEIWRKEDKRNCVFCTSSNVEISDVAVNDYKLYDFDRLVMQCKITGEYMLIVNVNKRNSQISMQKGGSPELDQEFLKLAVSEIVNLIESKPEEQFKSHEKGNFHICITGGTIFRRLGPKIRIETVSLVGIAKDEILKAIKPLMNEVGII